MVDLDKNRLVLLYVYINVQCKLQHLRRNVYAFFDAINCGILTQRFDKICIPGGP